MDYRAVAKVLKHRQVSNDTVQIYCMCVSMCYQHTSHYTRHTSQVTHMSYITSYTHHILHTSYITSYTHITLTAHITGGNGN